MDDEKAESQPSPPPLAEEKRAEAEQPVRSKKVVKKEGIDDAKRVDEVAVQRSAGASSSSPSSVLGEKPTDRSRRGDEPSPLVRWYQEKQTEWLQMPNHAGAEWLKKEGLTKGERVQLRRFRKQLKKGELKREKRRQAGRPEQGMPESSDSSAVVRGHQSRLRGLGAAAQSKELLDWYTETETQWMAMSFAAARTFLDERGLSKAERATLEAMHPQYPTEVRDEAKASASIKPDNSRERKTRGAEMKGGADDAEKEGKAANEAKGSARPVWLDLDSRRFKEFLEKEVVVATVQREMRKTWKVERKRVREAKRRRNPDLVDVRREREEKRMRQPQLRQLTLDSLWGTEANGAARGENRAEDEAGDGSQTAAQKKESPAPAAPTPAEPKQPLREPPNDGIAAISSPSPSASSVSVPALTSSSPSSALIPPSESLRADSLSEQVQQTVVDDLVAMGHVTAQLRKAQLSAPSVRTELRYRLMEEKSRAAIGNDEERAKREPKVVVQVREQMMEEAKVKAAAEGKPAPTTAIFLTTEGQAEQSRRIEEERQRRSEYRAKAGAAKAAAKATVKVRSKPPTPSPSAPSIDVVGGQASPAVQVKERSSRSGKESTKGATKKSSVKKESGEAVGTAAPSVTSPEKGGRQSRKRSTALREGKAQGNQKKQKTEPHSSEQSSSSQK